MKQVHLLGLQNHETDDRILAGDEADPPVPRPSAPPGVRYSRAFESSIVDEVVMPGAGFQRFRIRG